MSLSLSLKIGGLLAFDGGFNMTEKALVQCLPFIVTLSRLFA